ncbi:MAG: GldG family protein [Gammaproteobacteria bacterium]
MMLRLISGRRLALRAQSIALIAALLALAGFAAWATLAWQAQVDVSYGHRNSLGAASRKVLAALKEPVEITAFARPGTQVARIERRLLERYRRVEPGIRLRFVNPDTALGEMRKLGITTVGELYVQYGARGGKLDKISEAGISSALLRLARGSSKEIVFITGHGEASPTGKHNYDLGRFGAALKRQGFEIATRNLADGPELGAKTALVVVAGAQSSFAASEVTALRHWLAGGGNLLWLHNPGPLNGLTPIADWLGVKPLDGTIISTASGGFGVKSPTALVVTDYGKSPITRGFSLNTLFPDATGFQLTGNSAWKPQVLVKSRHFPKSWLMIGGPQNGKALYRPKKDVPGPVPIAIAFTRKSGKQRAVLVGDTSFLANSFLGNGGNLNLGLKLVNWLTGEDRFLDITPARAPDRSLNLSTAEQIGIAFGFLVFLPLMFLLAAGALALVRRRR